MPSSWHRLPESIRASLGDTVREDVHYAVHGVVIGKDGVLIHHHSGSDSTGFFGSEREAESEVSHRTETAHSVLASAPTERRKYASLMSWKSANEGRREAVQSIEDYWKRVHQALLARANAVGEEIDVPIAKVSEKKEQRWSWKEALSSHGPSETGVPAGLYDPESQQQYRYVDGCPVTDIQWRIPASGSWQMNAPVQLHVSYKRLDENARTQLVMQIARKRGVQTEKVTEEELQEAIRAIPEDKLNAYFTVPRTNVIWLSDESVWMTLDQDESGDRGGVSYVLPGGEWRKTSAQGKDQGEYCYLESLDPDGYVRAFSGDQYLERAVPQAVTEVQTLVGKHVNFERNCGIRLQAVLSLLDRMSGHWSKDAISRRSDRDVLFQQLVEKDGTSMLD